MFSLNEFLNQLHTRLLEEPRVIVSGNDSAGKHYYLDSIICALLFAYFSQAEDTSKTYIPVVKVPREDLELRPELKYVFEQVGLDYHKLVCLEDIPQQGELVLVDHNHATAPFDETWTVIGVLDHHVDEGLYNDSALRRIEMVGSCVSLILSHFSNVRLDETLAKLAMAPLLVDTINLEWDLGRTTQLDIDCMERLKSVVGDVEGYFDSIEKAKAEVDQISNENILRKDYKEFQVGPYRIGTSSVTWNFEGWFQRENGSQMVTEATKKYAKQKKLDLEIIFTSFNHGQGNYKRQLGLFIFNNDLGPLRKAMEEDDKILLVPIEEEYYYDQNNVKMSRKQVWPWVRQWIEDEFNLGLK